MPQTHFHLIAQRGKFLQGRKIFARQAGRHAEATDRGHVLGAGTPAPLLAAALDGWLRRDCIGHNKSADPLRPTDLVRRE
jgi:hypothetical protein